MQVKSIIVVGGGTAGWLSAGYLSSQLKNIKITVIESDQIPMIGVGETTVPQFRSHLEKMGLDETTWLRDSGSTFKYGAKFVNWRTGNDERWHGFGDYLTEKFISHSPFEFGKESVNTKTDKSITADYWIKLLQLGLISEEDFTQLAGDTYYLQSTNSAPKDYSGHQYMSRVPGYAYNINAWKVGQSIKNRIATPNGVEHLRKHISEVLINSEGDIEGLIDSTGKTHSADLYIDCTGFKRLLIGKTTKWISFENRLPCKNAIGGRVSYNGDEEKFMTPELRATALSSGWSWRVPLRDDMGSGYVYDSNFISHEDAEQELINYWRNEGKNFDLKVRLEFSNGIMENCAFRNVVACGLACNFLEPLEATSISFTTLINELVATMLNKRGNTWTPHDSRVISRLMHREIRYTCDYLWMHYALSQRTDSEFWITQSKNREQARKLAYSWFMDLSDIYRREKDFNHTRYNKYDWAQMITSQRIYEDCPVREINENWLVRAKLLFNFKSSMSQTVIPLVPSHPKLINHINNSLV